jgi:hypothetical protein
MDIFLYILNIFKKKYYKAIYCSSDKLRHANAVMRIQVTVSLYAGSHISNKITLI